MDRIRPRNALQRRFFRSIAILFVSLLFATAGAQNPGGVAGIGKRFDSIPKGGTVMWSTDALNAEFGTKLSTTEVKGMLTERGLVPLDDFGAPKGEPWSYMRNLDRASGAAKAGVVYDGTPRAPGFTPEGGVPIRTLEQGFMTGETGINSQGVGAYGNGKAIGPAFDQTKPIEFALPERAASMQKFPALKEPQKWLTGIVERAPLAPKPPPPAVKVPAPQPLAPAPALQAKPAAPAVAEPTPARPAPCAKTASPKGPSPVAGLALNVGLALLAEPAADALFPAAAKNRDKRLAMKQAMEEDAYQDERVRCWSKGIGIQFKSHAEVQRHLSKHGGDYIDFKNCTVDSDRYPNGDPKVGFGTDLRFELRPDDYDGKLLNMFRDILDRDIDRNPLSNRAFWIKTLKEPGGEAKVQALLAPGARDILQKQFQDDLGKAPSHEQVDAMVKLLKDGTNRWQIRQRVKQVDSAYEEVLGRKADESGAAGWLAFNGDKKALRASFASSDEFQKTVQDKFEKAVGRKAFPDEMQTIRTLFADGTISNQKELDALLRVLATQPQR